MGDTRHGCLLLHLLSFPFANCSSYRPDQASREYVGLTRLRNPLWESFSEALCILMSPLLLAQPCFATWFPVIPPSIRLKRSSKMILSEITFKCIPRLVCHCRTHIWSINIFVPLQFECSYFPVSCSRAAPSARLSPPHPPNEHPLPTKTGEYLS